MMVHVRSYIPVFVFGATIVILAKMSYYMEHLLPLLIKEQNKSTEQNNDILIHPAKTKEPQHCHDGRLTHAVPLF